MPETPGVPDRGDAGLRAANPRLRELLAEQDAEVAALRDLLKALQSQVADFAAQVKANSRNSSRLPSSDGPAKPAPKSLRGRSGRKPGRPKGRPGATMVLSENPDKKVRHRLAKCGCCGKSLMNAPVTASAGKFALFTVHAKRGRDGMKAAGVLLSFAVQDAWAQQVIDALLALGGAAEAARAAGRPAIGPETRTKHEDWYRQAAAAGTALNAARQGKLPQKRHALARRMRDREDDYLRFARDLRVPFTNNEAERAIRMSKLRIRISGCMRSTAGAEDSARSAPTSPLPPATASARSAPSPGPSRAAPGSPKPYNRPGPRAPASPARRWPNIHPVAG